jgi:hypothetical protein
MTRRLLLIYAVFAAAVRGEAMIDPGTRFDEVVTPGSKLAIRTTLAENSIVTFDLYHLGGAKVESTGGKADAAHQVSYQLPLNLDAGRYYLTITSGANTETVPGELRINPSGVQLDYPHPATAYRESKSGLFDFDVIGNGFSTQSENNHVLVEGQGDIIASYGHNEAECRSKAEKPCLWAENAQKMHVYGYKGEPYQGPLELRVRVGSVTTPNKQSLVLARMSAGGVFFAALGIFLLLCFLIYRLVRGGVDDHVVEGKPLPPWAAFFLDRSSNSYSLSKFQLFAFAFVFLFGYLYVFFCRWLVQWQFLLPDIPGNLSTMLAISAGTTITAAGATNAKGNKGGGNLTPAFADFVSTGGLVVPERFQFFVWTVVACFGFVALLISQNPATIKEFPNFPDGLLYVMGVSSAGYLGGKLVRKAGPIMKNIAVSAPADGLMNVVIQGENLSDDADFFIDGQKLPLLPDDKKPKGPDGKPISMLEATPQDGASDPSFASQLKIKVALAAASLDLRDGDHVFRIMNPDGQYHEIRFTLSPLKITGTGTVAAGDAEAPVSVTGSNFQPGTTARWTKPGTTDPVNLPAEKVQIQSDTKLTVTLVPGKQGTGTLQLCSANGFTATATVIVA